MTSEKASPKRMARRRASAPDAPGPLSGATPPPPRIATSPDAYPPTGRFVEAGGRRVHAHVLGPQGAPAVVLIHGASGSGRDYTYDLAPRLAGRYRVIAFDRPGLGHTPALHDRGESPAEQAALLDDATAALAIRRAVIVGHSYGAAVAMTWALERPARAAGLVSLAGATMPWPGGLGPWYAIASSGLGGATVVPLVSRLATPALIHRSIAAVFEPQEPPPGYAAHIGVGLTLRPATLRANARQVNTLRPHIVDMAGRYGGLDLPVEVVHGTADEIVPVRIHGARMVERIAGARLTLLEGVGHMPHHSDPDAAIAAIDRVAARAGMV
jgi:pimeloyl-ACP methyl ester carboxylesterase